MGKCVTHAPPGYPWEPVGLGDPPLHQTLCFLLALGQWAHASGQLHCISWGWGERQPVSHAFLSHIHPMDGATWTLAPCLHFHFKYKGSPFSKQKFGCTVSPQLWYSLFPLLLLPHVTFVKEKVRAFQLHLFPPWQHAESSCCCFWLFSALKRQVWFTRSSSCVRLPCTEQSEDVSAGEIKHYVFQFAVFSPAGSFSENKGMLSLPLVIYSN